MGLFNKKIVKKDESNVKVSGTAINFAQEFVTLTNKLNSTTASLSSANAKIKELEKVISDNQVVVSRVIAMLGGSK
jgi:hypothetical protein